MKKNLLRTMVPALAFALSISGGMTVFANEAMDKPMLIAEKEVNEVTFAKYYGVVSAMEKFDGSLSVTISDDFGELLVLNLNEKSKVYDAENNSFIELSALKEGDKLAAIMSANSAMTLSLPPIANDAAYLIKTNDNMNIKIGAFDENLLSSDDELQLNVGRETVIMDTMGTKKIFTPEDIKNAQCAVIYSVSTMSIPAQTSPEAVIVLEAAKVEEDSYYVPLRSTLEAEGFKVEWVANDKPIVATKDGVAIKLSIGSSFVTINGNRYDLASATKLVGDVAHVDSGLLKLI